MTGLKRNTYGAVAVTPVDRPAPCVALGHDHDVWSWLVVTRPAPTVDGAAGGRWKFIDTRRGQRADGTTQTVDTTHPRPDRHRRTRPVAQTPR